MWVCRHTFMRSQRCKRSDSLNRNKTKTTHILLSVSPWFLVDDRVYNTTNTTLTNTHTLLDRT